MLIASIAVFLIAPPVVPVVQLPGEVYPEGWKLFGVLSMPDTGLPMTNTMMGSIIVWVIIGLLTIYVATRRPSSGDEVPRGGFYNLFEMAFEGLYNFIGGIAAGPYQHEIFKVFMTIFLIVLLSNWLELIPSVDSIGFLEPHYEEIVDEETGEVIGEELTDGFETIEILSGVFHLNGKCEWISPEAATELTPEEQQARADRGCVTGTGVELPPPVLFEGADDHGDEAAHDEEQGAAESEEAAPEGEESAESAEEAVAGEAEHAEEEVHIPIHAVAAGDPNVPWVVLPYVRVPSTDLNLTIALAIIAVVWTQAIGFRALGIGYLGKFFNFKTIFTSPLGGIDVAVGLLELVGEFAKLLSFSFRLLGNIFAGSILLFVTSFVFPIIFPLPFFILEFFVGIIQAVVFGLLTAIFMNLATQSHDHDEHDDAHAH